MVKTKLHIFIIGIQILLTVKCYIAHPWIVGLCELGILRVCLCIVSRIFAYLSDGIRTRNPSQTSPRRIMIQRTHILTKEVHRSIWMISIFIGMRRFIVFIQIVIRGGIRLLRLKAFRIDRKRSLADVPVAPIEAVIIFQRDIRSALTRNGIRKVQAGIRCRAIVAKLKLAVLDHACVAGIHAPLGGNSVIGRNIVASLGHHLRQAGIAHILLHRARAARPRNVERAVCKPLGEQRCTAVRSVFTERNIADIARRASRRCRHRQYAEQHHQRQQDGKDSLFHRETTSFFGAPGLNKTHCVWTGPDTKMARAIFLF